MLFAIDQGSGYAREMHTRRSSRTAPVACCVPPAVLAAAGCCSPGCSSGGSSTPAAVRGRRAGPRRAAPGDAAALTPVLRAEAELARLRCPRLPVRHDEGARSTTRSPAEGDIKLAVARKKATGPGKRLGSLLVNPGGPGGSAVGYLQAYAGIGYPAAGPRPVRHGRRRPARAWPAASPSNASTGRADGHVHADRPDPGRRGGDGRAGRPRSRSSRRAARSARARCCRMSPRSRRPGTWTSCGPCWATRS